MSKQAGSTFTGLGKSQGYQSTVKMNFRGQDKTNQPKLGKNPNDDQDDHDEYIVNLQQQIHFMELEMRILKEKVTEDEKKSGIGSLYDDDKTSHQHIHLLKTKYAKMKRDHDKEDESLDKRKLNVVGEGYILKAQIDTLKDCNSKIDTNFKDYETQVKKQHFDLGRDNQQAEKSRAELDREIRAAMEQKENASTEHFSHWQQLTLSENDEAERKRRHDKEVGLNSNLTDKKKEEIAQLEAELAAQEEKFAQWKEIQDLLAECRDLKAKIEDAHVEIMHKDVEVKANQESVNMLNEKKAELTESKTEAEHHAEELRQQVKSQLDLADKRLQQRLNRDKDADTKELLAQEEMMQVNNADLEQKLGEEVRKYDQLLKDRLILDEKLKLLKEQMSEDSEKVELQKEQMMELKTSNEQEARQLEEQNAELEEQRKINLREEAKQRELNLKYAALSQKLQFIENNYDYKTNVTNMNLETLKSVMQSNNQINQTVTDFVDRMDVVKQEIIKLDVQNFNPY